MSLSNAALSTPPTRGRFAVSRVGGELGAEEAQHSLIFLDITERPLAGIAEDNLLMDCTRSSTYFADATVARCLSYT